MDVPDTDFEAALYEITRDGTSILLTTDALRARYRKDPRRAELVTPGAVEPYVFDSFTFVARRLANGSRLRLALACPNSIHQQKNYNSGGDVSAETAIDARTAHVTLYHDADHLSRLVLPVTGP
jgi:predicted acyl esterase